LNAYYFRSSLTGQRPGTAISVIGTTNVSTTASDGVPDSSWECFLDNVSIGSKSPYNFPENNWVLCQADSLSDSLHNITLRATVRNQNTFWFDRIVYSPSSSVDLDSSLIMVDKGDSAVTYGPGWQDMSVGGTVGKMTLQQGANATVDFSGEYLALMGQKSGLV
jgi:hypothetical protein